MICHIYCCLFWWLWSRLCRKPIPLKTNKRACEGKGATCHKVDVSSYLIEEDSSFHKCMTVVFTRLYLLLIPNRSLSVLWLSMWLFKQGLLDHLLWSFKARESQDGTERNLFFNLDKTFSGIWIFEARCLYENLVWPLLLKNSFRHRQFY